MALLCLMGMPLLACAQQSLLETPFRTTTTSGTTGSILQELQDRSGLRISFSASSLDLNRPVRLSGSEQTVAQVLQAALAGQPVSIRAGTGQILIVPLRTSRKGATTEASVTLNGYIRDRESREVLIGAAIYAPDLQAGTFTNAYGFYSLTLPAGNHRILASYIGYGADTIRMNLLQDERRDVLLKPQNNLQEAEVVSERRPGASPDHTSLSAEDISARPALLGEPDLMRSLQHIAGVQSTTEGSSRIVVRGGDPGQNLHLLDGVPLYYVDHFFGLTSVYHTEAIKSVDLYKGGFPARFGDRLSSIIDVHSRDGNMERWGGQFSLGPVKSSLNLEGPLKKNRSSVMLSARRTWIDGLVVPISRALNTDLAINFYDVNLKLNYILNPNNRLYLSLYSGRDQLGLQVDETDLRTRWGNNVAAAKWTSVLNPRLFLSTTLTYSRFQYSLRDRQQVIDSGLLKQGGAYTGRSSIQDAAIGLQARWYPRAGHQLELGMQYAYTGFIPTSVELSFSHGGVIGASPISSNFSSSQLSFYAEDEWRITDRWTLRPGIRWTNWFNRDFNYRSLQPRMLISYKLSRNHKLYASFMETEQFLHLITSNTFGLPADFWVPSTARITPEQALIGALGVSGSGTKNFKYSLELYYKDSRGLTMYVMGKDIFDNTERWQDKLEQGRGWSYGAELSLQRSFGPLHLSGAYTLSRTWRQFDQLNGGRAFPYRSDRRHNLKLGLNYKPHNRFDLGANWMFMSGEAITMPDQILPDLDNNLLIQTPGQVMSNAFTYHFSEMNGYRLPPLHRLDVALNFRKQKKRHMQRTWTLGVYNAYGRPNVMYVTLQNEGPGAFSIQGFSLLTFIPHISYQLKF